MAIIARTTQGNWSDSNNPNQAGSKTAESNTVIVRGTWMGEMFLDGTSGEFLIGKDCSSP